MRVQTLRCRFFTLLLSTGCVLGLAALQACSMVTVKANNPPATTPAYYLRGRNMPALKTEAARLCPYGFVATREWQSYEGPDHSGHVLKNALAYVWDWAAPPAFDAAQLDVQCNAAPQTAAPATAPVAAPVSGQAASAAAVPQS